MDHPIGWVPDAPYPHLMPTVWTDEWILPHALLIPLPVRQSRDDLDRALDHPLDLRQGRSNHPLHLGKRLRRLHPIIADTLEAFGHRVLHHPADKRVHRDSFVLHPLREVRTVMGRCLTGVDVLYSKPSLNPILPNTIECDHDSPSPALSPLPRDRYCPSWPDSAREATVPLPRATLCQSYLPPGL